MKLFVGAVLFALACSGSAVAATVHGKFVQRSITSIRAVPNVLLTLRSANNARSARVYTDRAGEFWFYNVPRGSYTLEIWRNGMDENKTRATETCKLDVSDGEAEIGTLRLHNRPVRPGAPAKSCREGLEHLYIGTDG
jgi:hypothetical protein